MEYFYSLFDEKSDSFSNRISDLTIPMDDVVSPGPPTSESIALRPPLKTQIYEKDGIITDKHK